MSERKITSTLGSRHQKLKKGGNGSMTKKPKKNSCDRSRRETQLRQKVRETTVQYSTVQYSTIASGFFFFGGGCSVQSNNKRSATKNKNAAERHFRRRRSYRRNDVTAAIRNVT